MDHDRSQAGTCAAAKPFRNPPERQDRLVLPCAVERQGVGGPIATGGRLPRNQEMDIAVVIGGDAQTDPGHLLDLLDSVVFGETGCAKASRVFGGAVDLRATGSLPRQLGDDASDQDHCGALTRCELAGAEHD